MSPESLEIDRVFDGVGRLKRRIDSTNPVLKRKYNRMLDSLKDDGRTDVIRAIKAGDIAWSVAYEAWVRRRLDSLPVGELAPVLVTRMQSWLDSLIVGEQKGADCSAKYFEQLDQARKYFEAADAGARLADLPALLERLRLTLGAKHPTSFNATRAAALRFVRSTLKKSHPLYLQVTAVERREVKERDRRQGVPLSVEQMEEFFPNRDSDELDGIAWGMATTGMGEKEYFVDGFRILADRVRIGGKKRRDRMRDVPLVIRPRVPSMHRRTFTDKLRKRTDRFIQPYDLRRTYANWLEDIGIVRARRKVYMGHSAGDVTGLYERQEMERYLASDAKRIREFLGLPPTESPTLTLEKGKSA